MGAQAFAGKRTATAAQTVYSTGVILLVALFVLVTYTFLHEGGHAILGFLFGGTITELSMNFLNLSAHVGIVGEFTTLQQCIIAVSGTLFPLLVWATCIYLAPRKSGIVVDALKLVGSLAVLNTLLAWIIIPILYASGSRPGDDSVNFLNYSAAPPLTVTGTALLLYAGGWAFYFWRSGGLQGIRNLVSRLRFHTDEFFAPAERKALLIVVLCGSIVGASSWGFSSYLTAVNPQRLPAGYSHLVTLNLNERGYVNEAVHQFTLDQQATVGFYIVLQDLISGPIDITLTGSDGYRNTFFKTDAESFGAPGFGRATVHPQHLVLEKGSYSLQLTAPEGGGQVVVAARIEGAGSASRAFGAAKVR